MVTQKIPRKKEQALREKTLNQEYLDFSIKSTLKLVKEYRGKYKRIGQILEANPKILDLAHEDFSRALSKSSMADGAIPRNRYCVR